MEDTKYKVQVTKLSTALRVIDEHQIDRHFQEHDLKELYSLTKINPPARSIPQLTENDLTDKLLKRLIQNNPDLVYKFESHDSLLENKMEQTLSKDEMEAAWKEYRDESDNSDQRTTTLRIAEQLIGNYQIFLYGKNYC